MPLGKRFEEDNYCLVCMVADSTTTCDYCGKDTCADCQDCHGMCEHCQDELALQYDQYNDDLFYFFEDQVW